MSSLNDVQDPVEYINVKNNFKSLIEIPMNRSVFTVFPLLHPEFHLYLKIFLFSPFSPQRAFKNVTLSYFWMNINVQNISQTFFDVLSILSFLLNFQVRK